MMPSFDKMDKEGRGGPLRTNAAAAATEEKKVEEKEGETSMENLGGALEASSNESP
jgi:hypothetical protein